MTLTAIINDLSQEDYEKALQEAEDNGILEAEKWANKADLLSRLGEFDKVTKDNLIKNLTEGKAAFDD